MQLTDSKKTSYILTFSVCSIFIGRAWQFIFWDAPYRSFFWDEELLKPLIESFCSISWYAYVTSSSTDMFIDELVFYTGLLYAFAAVSCLLLLKHNKKILKGIVLLGGINLVLLSFLLMKDKFYEWAMFFEHSIQFGLPFVFLYALKSQPKNLLTIAKLLIAVVFVSHGLYAVGYYPVPGKFVDMVIHVFSFSEEKAKLFLLVAGGLDFILAIFIFVPKVAKYALSYAVFWGLLTAFARIVTGFQTDFMWQSIHQELHGTLFRLSHGLLPLLALLLENKKENTSS
ncbi:hypothetical protein [Flavicella sediminum]|uniref:hypothetical protein n=1 Tax=Flavicella sediminum TaxID=2585141 RepID=UPI0011203709|nr:hypothetical protein [Flavicella sediminum]